MILAGTGLVLAAAIAGTGNRRAPPCGGGRRERDPLHGNRPRRPRRRSRKASAEPSSGRSAPCGSSTAAISACSASRSGARTTPASAPFAAQPGERVHSGLVCPAGCGRRARPCGSRTSSTTPTFRAPGPRSRRGPWRLRGPDLPRPGSARRDRMFQADRRAARPGSAAHAVDGGQPGRSVHRPDSRPVRANGGGTRPRTAVAS